MIALIAQDLTVQCAECVAPAGVPCAPDCVCGCVVPAPSVPIGWDEHALAFGYDVAGLPAKPPPN